MRRTVMVMGLAAFLAADASAGAQAMPIVPFSKATIQGLSDVSQASWRRCWRDRWGRLRCTRCWRDRWGRVRCR
jgi:hypothetical protein